MKLKIKWEENFHYDDGVKHVTGEYITTPLGTVKLTLSLQGKDYKTPYLLIRPTQNNLLFKTREEAKQFAEDFLLKELTKLLDLIPTE